MIKKLVIITLLLSIVTVGSASAEEIVVDKTNPDNIDSLEAGLEKAEDGDKIIVKNTIPYDAAKIDKSVTITGNSRPDFQGTVIIEESGTTLKQFTAERVEVRADNVELRDFRLEYNGKKSLVVTGNQNTIKNFQMIYQKNADSASWPDNSFRPIVVSGSDNTIEDGTVYGAGIQDSSGNDYSSMKLGYFDHPIKVGPNSKFENSQLMASGGVVLEGGTVQGLTVDELGTGFVVGSGTIRGPISGGNMADGCISDCYNRPIGGGFMEDGGSSSGTLTVEDLSLSGLFTDGDFIEVIGQNLVVRDVSYSGSGKNVEQGSYDRIYGIEASQSGSVTIKRTSIDVDESALTITQSDNLDISGNTFSQSGGDASVIDASGRVYSNTFNGEVNVQEYSSWYDESLGVLEFDGNTVNGRFRSYVPCDTSNAQLKTDGSNRFNGPLVDSHGEAIIKEPGVKVLNPCD